MKSPLMWILSSYMASIFLFFNQNSVFMFWCFLEINMILLISLFYFIGSEDKMLNSDQCLFYFFVQSVGSFLILMSFKFSSLLPFSSLSDFIFSLSIVIKMGLWPFSSWIFNMSYSVSKIKMFILLSIQKIPLFYLIFSYPSMYTYFYFISSFLVGSILIFSSMSIMEILISSSIYSTVWVSYLFNNSLFFFFLYLLIYFIFLFIILNINSSTPMSKIFVLSSFIFFLGLPPFSLFFFKFFISNWLINSLSHIDFFLFWVFSFFALFGYTKIFFQHLFMKFFMYLNDENFSEKMFFLLLPSSYFLLFLI